MNCEIYHSSRGEYIGRFQYGLNLYIDVPECFPADIERFGDIHVSGMTCNMDIGVLDPVVELDPQPPLEGGARSRQQQ